jgi:signal transduction histidine kinase
VDDHLVRLQVATDITERKRVEAALRESEEQLQEYARDLKRMVEQKVRQLEQERANAAQLDRLAVLGEMASNVVHELRDPLTAIGFEADYLVWTAATAKEKHGGDLNATLNAATAGKIGKGLQGDLARCQRLIDHLVNFGRISSEPASYICLNQPIEDSFILIGARLRGCDIDVRLDLADDLPPILANPHRLEQVFINLINNAEHAMEGKASEQPDYRKELEITTAASGDEVIATVRDNGIGIPEDVRARIFDPFFTTKPRGDGMGLGLSTSASIVAEYGGEITFESVEGEGATFMLRFPVAELGKKGAE